MADSRTATALTITALAFLNVIFLSIVVLSWGQTNSLSQELDLEKRALAAQSEDLNSVSQERDSLLEAEQALQKDLDEQIRKVQRLEIEFEATEFSHDAIERYHDLFKSGDPKVIHQFLSDPNDSLATQAAWQLVKLTVPEQDGPGRHAAGSKELADFLEFFEYRNRIRIPDWWRNVVSTCKADQRDAVFSGVLDHENPVYGPPDENGGQYPDNFQLAESEEGVTLTVGARSVKIRRKYFQDGKLHECLNATFTDELCIVAIHSDGGYRHAVICIELASDKVLWKSTACGFATWSGSTGIPYSSWVTLEITPDGRVFVFGAGGGGFYAHAFELSNGRSLMYFASNF